MTMDRLQIAALLAGAVRTETMMGVSYAVFPAVLVREQVLHNNLGLTFLPADEIEETVEAWNGLPVVVDHPTLGGQPISARSPKVLNSRGAGFLFDARFEDNSLKADVYVDTARLAAVDGGGDVLTRIEAGEPGELSTGFGAALRVANGTHDGRKYEKVMFNIRPDHLALLATGVGACSLTDGCGLGVNHAGNCESGAPCPDAAPGWFSEQMAKLQAFFHRAIGGPGQVENESDADRRKVLGEALREQFDGPGVDYIWIEDVFSDDGTVVYEIEGGSKAGIFRSTYEIDDAGGVVFGEPEEVRRVTTYEPVSNEENMDRTQMIVALVAAATCALDESALEKLTDVQLTALFDIETPAADPPAEGGTEPGEARIAALEEQVAGLVTATADSTADREAERQRLVTELAANERCAFTQEDLESQPIESLRKLRASIMGVNYAARGGPRADATGEPAFMPTRPYFAEQDGASDGAGGNGGN